MSFLSITYLLFLTLSLVFITKNTFGKCLLFGIFISAFTLYFSQMFFKTFNYGFYLLIIFSLSWIVLLIYNLKKGKLKAYAKLIFNSGFIYFIVINVFVYIYDYSRTFSNWNEFSHWGVMIKEMFRSDKFYSINASTLMVHKDYPPIVQLYELLFVKLNFKYSENLIIKSIHFLEFSFFIITVENYKYDKKMKIVINSFIIPTLFILITSILDLHKIVNTIYVDYIMALLVAFNLFYSFKIKNNYNKFNILMLLLSSSFLILIKQMGLPLYLMICFYLVGSLFIEKKDILKKEKINYFIKNIKRICLFFMLLCIPLLVNYSWNKYISKFNLEKQFEVKNIKISELYDVYKGVNIEEYKSLTMNNFLDAITSKNLTVISLKLNYIYLMIISYVLLYFSLKKCDFNLRKLIYVTFFLGLIGYTFVMLNLYVFLFGPFEGPSLASYDRYMATYILIILYFIYFIFIINNEDKLKSKIILTIFLSLILFPTNLYDIRPAVRKHQKNAYEIHSDFIRKYVKDNDKVFLISQNGSGDSQFYIKYYVGPITTNLNNFVFNTNDDIDYNKMYDEIYINDIKDYDYLYIVNVDENFIEKYGYLFEEKIKEGNIYKIECDGKKIKYRLLNKTS